MLKVVKIKCQNGISLEEAKKNIFFELLNDYTFISSENPDFILFGPYGNDLPPKGDYERIGYFSENIIPDLDICEYAFGIPLESEINNPKYKRIQWHGINPEVLLKSHNENDIDRIVNTKTKFCNFLYSNPVPYREEFFRQLSKYKKIDSPGKSMKNMASIDQSYTGNYWERKRQFLEPYKFSIAFENYAYPGYQTEKLYDSMMLNSIPIYCGDENIHEIFNTASFVHVNDYTKPNKNFAVKFLEKHAQLDFKDYRPSFYKSPVHRIRRKFKSYGKKFKMKIQFNGLDFSDVINQIIKIDQDQSLYAEYLREPWFKENKIPCNTSLKETWQKIFDSKNGEQ